MSKATSISLSSKQDDLIPDATATGKWLKATTATAAAAAEASGGTGSAAAGSSRGPLPTESTETGKKGFLSDPAKRKEFFSGYQFGKVDFDRPSLNNDKK